MMKKYIITLALIISTMNLCAVQLPEWFMHPSKDTYVGISVPGGSAQDAICMALIQYLLAHDIPCSNEVPYSENRTDDKQYNSRYQPAIQVDSFLVQYTIQELSLLSSGEYICRITTGDKMNQIISMTFNRNVMIISDGMNQTIREQTLFRFTYGTSYILEYYDDINSVNEVVDEKGKIESVDRINGSFSKYYLPDENTQYTFPKTKAPAQSKGRSTIITSRSLAPQLLRAYSEIITDLGGAYSTSEKGNIRKATPITGFSNDNDFDFMLHIHYDF